MIKGGSFAEQYIAPFVLIVIVYMFMSVLVNLEKFTGIVMKEEEYFHDKQFGNRFVKKKPKENILQIPSEVEDLEPTESELEYEENDLEEGILEPQETEMLEKIDEEAVRPCLLDRSAQSDVGQVLEPKYKMDPSKFLAVAGSRGPNNQIVSLRDSIFFAIALNRTLIIPPFFKHNRADPTANSSNTEIVGFHQRMDLKRIKELISVIEPEDTLEKCGEEGFDVLYRIQRICQPDNFDRIQAIRDFYNFPSTPKTIDYAKICRSRSSLKEVPTIPSREIIESVFHGGNIIQIKSTENAKEEIRKYYASNYKCPLATYAYNSSPILRAKGKENEIGEISRDIIAHTQRPKHLKDFVDSFIKKYSPSKKFISIHWRYDESDWKNEQCKSRKFQLVCQNFELLTDPEQLASYLMKFFKASGADQAFDFVYIATPPNELKLIQSVQLRFEKKNKMKIVTQIEMIESLIDHYGKNCGEKYENLRFEILSLAEMEACVTSSVFYSSFGSSWSFNVEAERAVLSKGATYLNTRIFEADIKRK